MAEETKTCAKGHIHDSAWEICPYCDEGQTEETRTTTPPSKPLLLGWLVVMNGEHEGADFRIEEGTLILGKDASCDIVLGDEFVSSRHMELTCEILNEELVIHGKDLGSTNGSYLNNAEEPVSTTRIYDGDLIALGSTALKFRAF